MVSVCFCACINALVTTARPIIKLWFIRKPHNDTHYIPAHTHTGTTTYRKDYQEKELPAQMRHRGPDFDCESCDSDPNCID